MSRDIKEQVQNLTECSVCSDTLTDPRILPCVHTYCLKCIRGFSSEKQAGDRVTCPICRNEFVVPGNGVEGLPKNFSIEQLKDVADPLKKYCEGCSDELSDPASRKEAAMYCVDCQQRFCESCVEVHRRVKHSRGNKLVDSCDNENIRAAVREVKTILCEKHPTRTVEMYCLDCKEVICMMCFAESHKLHECSDVNKVVDEFRQQMKNDVDNLNETMRKCEDALKEQEKNKDDFNKAVEEMEKEIVDRAEKLKKEIDLEREKLLEELASRKAERMKEMKRVTENIKRHMSFVMSLAKYTEELREQGSASDVAQQERSSHKRADELMNIDINREIVELGCIEARVELSTEAVECVIGRIKWQVRVKEVPCSGSWRPTLRHVIGADGESDGVADVTSVDDRLFVLREPSQQLIEVYELKTFTLEHTLQVTGLGDSSDNGLTACVMNKCLYVSDHDYAAVYKVELRVDNKISKWSVGRGPCGVSINSACNLLVACWDDPKIEEYETRSGSLVREIRLESNDGKSLSPSHVIELTSGQFVVSSYDMNFRWDVVEVDVNGRVVVSYTNQLQSTKKHRFEWSRHLAVDKNNECILVADCNNDRIVILSRFVNVCAREFDVTSLDGRLQTPSCVHLDESQRRLFLGEWSGRVLVSDDVFV